MKHLSVVCPFAIRLSHSASITRARWAIALVLLLFAGVPSVASAASVKDVLAVLHAGTTGSGMTEVHDLAASTTFSSFNFEIGTPLNTVRGSDSVFALGDYNGDGVLDLYSVIHDGPTGSGMTEVHVLDGATNFTSFLLHAATPLTEYADTNATFLLGDYNNDDRPDLYAIVHDGSTGSGSTEVHVLDGASGFSSFFLHAATPLNRVSDANAVFQLGDADRDGKLDVYAILHDGPTQSGSSEIHILSGASSFSSFLLETGTPLWRGHASDAEYRVADYNNDGVPDVYAILHAGVTGSGMTEVHVLDGANAFGGFLVEVSTPLSRYPSQDVSFRLVDLDDDWRPDVQAILHDGPTGSGTTEVHTLSGAQAYGSFIHSIATPLSRYSSKVVTFPDVAVSASLAARYPTSWAYGGANHAVDTEAEIAALAAALTSANNADFDSLLGGLSPTDYNTMMNRRGSTADWSIDATGDDSDAGGSGGATPRAHWGWFHFSRDYSDAKARDKQRFFENNAVAASTVTAGLGLTGDMPLAFLYGLQAIGNQTLALKIQRAREDAHGNGIHIDAGMRCANLPWAPDPCWPVLSIKPRTP